MKIGVDIDGVLIDFEERLRVRASLFDFNELKNDKILKDCYWVQDRYGWGEKEWGAFSEKYLVQLTKESHFKPCAVEVLNMLKKEGHELVVISTRGTEYEEMVTVVQNMINNHDLHFDKIYWKLSNKIETCKNEKVDIMIDDNPTICENLSKEGIKTLYFRNIYGDKLKENEFLEEVHDWGEIYRKINL